MVRFFFRIFWLPLYRRWALWHIRREQRWQYGVLRLKILPGVFHPGIFFSTPLFMDYLQNEKLHGCSVLDMGTGSGALALLAARKGARAFGADLSEAALHCAAANARDNQVMLTLWHSDLFESIPPQTFDYIVVNPPYYAREPRTTAEHAFFAGAQLEYFDRFFQQLPGYAHAHTRVWMILSQDCDWKRIQQQARQGGFESTILWTRRKWGERFFIGNFFVKNADTR